MSRSGDGSRMSVGGGRRSRLALSRPAAAPACVFARYVQRLSVLVELMLVRERKARPARKSALSHHRKFAESVLTLNSALLQLIGGAVTSVELSREVRANLFRSMCAVFFGEGNMALCPALEASRACAQVSAAASKQAIQKGTIRQL